MEWLTIRDEMVEEQSRKGYGHLFCATPGVIWLKNEEIWAGWFRGSTVKSQTCNHHAWCALHCMDGLQALQLHCAYELFFRRERQLNCNG